MELVKTYDNVGNVSEETYIEDGEGMLVEVFGREIGEEIDERAELGRIYYQEKK